MKKILLIALMLSISICSIIGIINTTTHGVEGEENKTTICVIGEACKEACPDIAIITASIETFGENVEEAKELNEEIYQNVSAQLESSGVDINTITTHKFSVIPFYDWSSNNEIKEYIAINSFSFEINNLENIKLTLDNINEAGVTRIKNISYQISNQEELYNQALSEALENAKEKALALSTTDLEVISIKEEFIFTTSNHIKNFIEPVSFGKICINARILVEFSAI